MADANFIYIWKYAIRQERKAEFLAAYRANGDWAKLFSQDPDYIKTELLQDAADENVYMTIDYWTSKAARDAFKRQYSKEFAEMDKRCEAFTSNETFLGDFFIRDLKATGR